MGLCPSKLNDEDVRGHRPESLNNTRFRGDEDGIRLKKLSTEFHESPNSFILNMMLLSVQFFDNYENEMQRAWNNQVSDREKTLNHTSNLPHFRKHCLMPDILFETVTKRVLFSRPHGPKKDVPEPLVPQRMFVLHDNIEVPDLETSEYTSVDAPTYKAAMDDEFVNVGYCKLLKIDEFSLPFLKKKKSSDSDTSNTSDSSIIPTKIPRLVPKTPSPKVPSREGSIQSFQFPPNSGNRRRTDSDKSASTSKIKETVESDYAEDTDSTYDYARITEEARPKPLSREELTRSIMEMTTLPENCLTLRIMNNIDSVEDDDDEEDDENAASDSDNETKSIKRKAQLFHKRYYFNSLNFMKHFCNIFTSELGTKMGFSGENVRSATSSRCSIYVRGDFNYEYEVLPSIGITWPQGAYEWLIRDRREIEHKGRKIIYKWPTQKMVDKIKSLECVLLPYGFFPKRGTNEQAHLEWTIAFPKAERYLETRMSHAQVRCYLFILALYKTFLESENEKLGLSVYHIRTHMFWLCEHNYMDWPEDQLGAKVLKVLSLLNDCLARDRLPDYFICHKNLFRNIPSKYTNTCQYKIQNIIEYPVMHFLSALRNLKYTSGKFYPAMNFKELYSIITSVNSVKEVNPALYKELMKTEIKYTDSESEDDTMSVAPICSNNVDKKLKWTIKYYEQQEEKRKKAKRKKEEEQRQKAQMNRASVDSIEYSYVLNNREYDGFKRRALLSYFIKHFLKIAKQSKHFHAFQQGLFYTKQAWYLSQILSDLPSGEEEANDYLMHIQRLEEELKMRLHNESTIPPPRTPKRNSTFHLPDLSKIQVQNTVINRTQLEKNYNQDNVPAEESSMSPATGAIKKKKKKAPAPLMLNNLSVTVDVHERSRPSRTRSRAASILIPDNTLETTDL